MKHFRTAASTHSLADIKLLPAPRVATTRSVCTALFVISLLMAACGGSDAAANGEVPASAGLLTPESAVHDTASDTYIVSNIGSFSAVTDLVAKDNNGFLSRVRPDATVEQLKWIAGGQSGVVLHSPRGLALQGDELWVADLDTVRIFDKVSGAARAQFVVPNAVLLNDVVSMSDGTVLVTDTGLKPTGMASPPLAPVAASFAVYRVHRDGRIETVSKTPDLLLPNGVAFAKGETLIATYGSKDILSIDANGKATKLLSLPLGSLDGIEFLDDGDLIVSAQDGKGAVYRVGANRVTVQVLVADVSGADIGLDRARRRVLIPILFENRLLIRTY